MGRERTDEMNGTKETKEKPKERSPLEKLRSMFGGGAPAKAKEKVETNTQKSLRDAGAD